MLPNSVIITSAAKAALESVGRILGEDFSKKPYPLFSAWPVKALITSGAITIRGYPFIQECWHLKKGKRKLLWKFTAYDSYGDPLVTNVKREALIKYLRREYSPSQQSSA